MVVLFAAGCKKDTIEQPPEFGYDYFPTEIGRYNVYQVDSVVYNIPFDTIYTYSFQVKELNESYFTDSEEKQSIRLARYYRNTSNDAWVLKNVWSVRMQNGKAERQEENIRLVKLVFPVQYKKDWNINALNTLDEQVAEIDTVDAPYEVNGTNFPYTTSVNLIVDTNLINYKTHQEIYAKGIGLIYSELYDLFSQYDSKIHINKPSVLQRIQTGVYCKKSLIETGKQ